MQNYSSTITYIGSGLKYLIDTINLDELGTDKIYKIPEGIKAVYVVTLTSVVEGLIKLFLKDIVKDLKLKDKNQDLTSEHDAENNIFQVRTESNLTKEDVLKNLIDSEINRIESLTFENLKKEFKKITGESFSTVVNKNNQELANTINHIFKFRNFFIHGNSINIDIDNSDEFQFKGKSAPLWEFIRTKELENPDYRVGDHFIEKLFTKKALGFFVNAIYKEFLQLEIWKTRTATAEVITRIYCGE